MSETHDPSLVAPPRLVVWCEPNIIGADGQPVVKSTVRDLTATQVAGICGSVVGAFLAEIGVLPNVPGFLAQAFPAALGHVPGFWRGLYSYAWFVGFALAAAAYLALMRRGVRERTVKG